MRVPINSQTNVPQGQLGYERAVDVTAGSRALAAVVDKYAQQTADDQKKREMFDVQRLLVDETNNIQTDFDAKKQAQPLGAPNFTQQVNGEYNTRHTQMVKDLKDRGYSDEAVNEFATRLGTIRSQYVAQAIDFQDKSNYTKSLGDADAMATALSQHANTNPNSVGSALHEFRVSLTHLGLDAEEQEKLYQAGKGTILKGAQEGFAVQHPEIVLGLYAPTELTTTSPTNLPAGQVFDLHLYIGKMSGVEGTARNPRSSAVGFGQFLDSTWLGTYKEVFGNTGETRAQILAKKKDKPTALKLTEKLTSDNVQGLINAGKPVTDTTVYLSHFLGISDALKVLSAHADATVRGLVNSASIAANPGVFKKINTVSDLLSWAQNKMGVEPPVALAPIPANWKGNQEDAIQELGMTADQAAEYLRTGKDTRVGATPVIAQVVPSPYQLDANGQTGIAVLDLSSGPERMQMLTLARTIMNGREADAKAAQRVAHDTWYNGFLNQLQDGKLGQADLDTAYHNGQITDFDERRKAQGIIDDLNKKNDDLARFHVMMASGQKFNPYDNQAQKAVDAGFDNAVKYSAKHNNFASPFVIALTAWQHTGILPKQGGVMIRGGLIGTDPQRVGEAAAVANNMIRQNPNAFAGVEGQAEIEHAAVAYGHYIYDRGMSPEEAAIKVAQENDPKFKEKFKYNDPVTQELLKTLRQNGVDATRSFKGAKFPNQDALNEANQTYYEMLRDELNHGSDFGVATAQVETQMQKIYGPNSNGKIVKYPPERAYPSINGRWDYIYHDAQKTVKDETGRDPISVNLAPIPGVTDEDFRRGRLARYRIIYSYKSNGQTVIDSVPGEFAADINAARQEASVQNRKEFAKARQSQVLTQQKIEEGYHRQLAPGTSPVRY